VVDAAIPTAAILQVVLMARLRNKDALKVSASFGRVTSVRSWLGIGSFADWAFRQLCGTAAIVVIFLVALILLLLYLLAKPAFENFGSEIVTSTVWNPSYDPRTDPHNPRYDVKFAENDDDPYAELPAQEPGLHIGRFGGLAFIYGSVVTSALAMLLAVPLGVGTAAFLAEVAPPLVKRGGSFLVELLAAIPSVVYGFWGINFLAPAVQHVFDRPGWPNLAGKGILTAALILAIMIVPYVAAVSFDVCRSVPRSQREGALALGSTRWQMIWKVVLPYARPGIIGGCFLALGRAIGETMAVTMLIGNTPVIGVVWLAGFLPLPKLYARGDSIPSVIANQLAGANSDDWTSALVALALILFAVTVLMNIAARLLLWQVGRARRGPSLLARFWPKNSALAVGKIIPRRTTTRPASTWRAVAINRLMIGGEWSAVLTGLMTLAIVGTLVVVVQFAAAPADASAADARPVLLALLAAVGFVAVLATMGGLGLCLVLTCVPLFLIVGYIAFRGAGALNRDFFIKLPVPQGEQGGGLANALLGSGMIVGLATLFAVPTGLMAAIYLAEFRQTRVGSGVRFFGELLNGVPSIVVGTFVYALVHWFIVSGYLGSRYQFSGWAGSFALFCMMLPIVMRASEEALKLVPQTLRNASHALGAHHWQTVIRVSVPAALPAIITGAFLAIARIAGETAPLLMTAFGNDRFSSGPSDKTAFLPLYIYRYSTSGYKPWEDQAWAAALVLLAFIMLLNIGIRFLTGKRVVLASQAD
jgi:phosphate transport system permease protein